VGKKLSLKGVKVDNVGVTIQRPLDNVGESDLQLRTSSGFVLLSGNESTAYAICLAFYQIPDEA
jgi:hypothetical protein